MRHFSRELRVRAGVLLIIATALIPNIVTQGILLTKNEKLFYPENIGVSTDDIEKCAEKFEGLKKILPRKAIVEYVTDKGPLEHMKTQCVLSPVIVVQRFMFPREKRKEFVIADFQDGLSGFRNSKFNESGLDVIKEFENGLVLLRRQAK